MNISDHNLAGSNNHSLLLPPPIPENRKRVYEYYQLTFDKEGCPMKHTASGLVFHPILVPYLIIDYVSLYKKTGERSFLKYAQMIGSHALRRAECLGNALVFNYYPNTGLSNVPTKFYSALTQAWYVKAFCTLEEYYPQNYSEVIRKFFLSLMIGTEESGVLLKRDYGWIVEEYPHQPPFYTLNGWLTVLRWIVQCRKSLDRLGIQYASFLEHNLDAVEHLLPLFDAKFCLNSRYQLTGFSRIKILFDRPVAHECLSFEVYIPGEGNFPGALGTNKKSRWQNHLERSEARLLQFNVLLSLISKPACNVFRTRLRVDRACKATIYLAQGDYRPDASAMPTESWKELKRLSLQPEVENEVDCSVPFDGGDLFAYPTNFKKKIGGVMYNGYHFVHIVDLAELFAYSGRISLKETAVKWLEYIDGWESMPALASGVYSLKSHIYGDDLKEIIRRLLNS